MVTGSLVIALLFMGIGIIAGVLIMLLINWFSDKKPAAGADSKMGLYHPEARLWRDRTSSHLVVEVNDHLFNTSQGLSAAQRQKVENLLAELQNWLGLKAVAPIQPAPAPAGPRPADPAAQAPVPPFTPPAQPAPARLSIVEQINAVLQEKLAGTPLAGRSIRISEGLHQTVVVWIGSLRYEGIDSVPDPEVKTAIRAAVAEWERRAEKNSPSGQ